MEIYLIIFCLLYICSLAFCSDKEVQIDDNKKIPLKPTEPILQKCETCKGSKTVNGKKCQDCQGDGFYFTLMFPTGIKMVVRKEIDPENENKAKCAPKK